MKRILPVLAGVIAALSGFTDATAPPPAPPTFAVSDANGPTVMTRNLYLGADLDPLLTIGSPEQIPFVAAQVWAMVQATNFPALAGALAEEIARTRPHLIGLQEAVLYRNQSPGDAVLGGTVPATDVVYDFVQILLDSLRARGLTYAAVASVTNSDIELPVFTGNPPCPFEACVPLRECASRRTGVRARPAGAGGRAHRAARRIAAAGRTRRRFQFSRGRQPDGHLRQPRRGQIPRRLEPSRRGRLHVLPRRGPVESPLRARPAARHHLSSAASICPR